MSSEVIIGCLTIGQSPRPDILNEIAELLPNNCRVIELGALDNLSPTQLRKAIASEGDAFYVTLLSNGTEVSISQHALEGLLRSRLTELHRRGAQLAVLLCTGEFPLLNGEIPFLRGSEILTERVKREYRGKSIAVVVPNQGQAEHMSQRWNNLGVQHNIFHCLPYHETEESMKLCAKLQKSQADFIVLDCIGFTLEMAKRFGEQTGKNVILPRQIVAEHIISYIGNNYQISE